VVNFARRIALVLPCRNFDVEDGAITDAPIQALPAHDADLDLHHIQPTGMFGCVVKLQPLKNTVCFGCRKRFVQSASGMG
jgi:hypothetical protein